MQALAEALETALKEGRPLVEMPPLVDALQRGLEPLVQALEAQLPKAARPQAAATANVAAAVDEAQLAEVTARLRALLEDMDSEAGDWIQTHQALLNNAFPQHLQAINEAIEGFDFDVALEQLEAALAARPMESLSP